jgi:hypothetical protein
MCVLRAWAKEKEAGMDRVNGVADSSRVQPGEYSGHPDHNAHLLFVGMLGVQRICLRRRLRLNKIRPVYVQCPILRLLSTTRRHDR